LRAYDEAMVNARGFTLIEMMIALFIAALISIALSVVFRLGMNFLTRSRGYYSNLQESLAVVGYLRRSVSHIALDKVVGDDGIVLLLPGSKPDGSGSGFRCRASNDARWALESITVQSKNAKDAAAKAAPALPAAPGTQAPVTSTDSAKPVEQAVLPTAEQLQQAQSHVLLDGLETCTFEYLLGKPDPANTAQAQAQSGTNAPADANAAANSAAPTTYVWLGARAKGQLAAIRVSLATADAALPPIVLAPVK